MKVVVVRVVVKVVVVATFFDAFCFVFVFLTGILREQVGEHPQQSKKKRVEKLDNVSSYSGINFSRSEAS